MIEVKQSRTFPAWASGLVIVACLAGGAWLVWAFVAGGGPGDRIVVLDHAPGDGVRRSARDAWRIDAGTAGAQVRRTDTAPGGYQIDFFFERYEFLAPEEIDILTKTRRIVRDKSVAQELQVTPDQLKRLQEIRDRAKLQMDEAHQAQIRDNFPAYLAAEDAAERGRRKLGAAEDALRQANDKSPDEKRKAQAARDAARAEADDLDEDRRKASVPLIKAVRATAEALKPSAKQSASERAALAKTVLSEEQWKKFDAMGQ